MKVFVAGASGATGRLVVTMLLQDGHQVTALVRSTERLPSELQPHPSLSIETGSILDIPETRLTAMLNDCDGVASCLGHSLSFRGIYGSPRRLVRDSVRRICECIINSKSDRRVRLVLMNTTGNRNRDLQEPVSFAQRMIVGLIRYALPPHADNEQAADYLRLSVGQTHDRIEWVVVRPDSLTNETNVSQYEIHPSPIRSAIFDPGKTSRINVAHFMAQLLTVERSWQQWRGQMPVIYNEQ